MKDIVGIGVCFFALVGAAVAQSGPMIRVQLPANAMVGTTNLPAGSYTIREFESAGGSAVLDFIGPNGRNTNVLAIDATDAPEVADHSSVVLKSDGERLHVDKVIIEGREYDFHIAQ